MTTTYTTPYNTTLHISAPAALSIQILETPGSHFQDVLGVDPQLFRTPRPEFRRSGRGVFTGVAPSSEGTVRVSWPERAVATACTTWVLHDTCLHLRSFDDLVSSERRGLTDRAVRVRQLGVGGAHDSTNVIERNVMPQLTKVSRHCGKQVSKPDVGESNIEMLVGAYVS